MAYFSNRIRRDRVIPAPGVKTPSTEHPFVFPEFVRNSVSKSTCKMWGDLAAVFYGIRQADVFSSWRGSYIVHSTAGNEEVNHKRPRGQTL